ncbi:MAG: Rieske 2Fe-2S domain-containing protein [Acidobacteriota bacterium]|nr:MAG: ubiquinol-cytochrome c reductase iron-sulfur subunit [Acidobacteriota bacterium]
MSEATTGFGRRKFINWFLGTSLGGLLLMIVYPIVRYISPPEIPEATTNQVEAGREDDPELLEKGYKIVQFGVEPVILFAAGPRDFRAFSATCTHLDCIVEFQKQEKRIFCNCHGGVYDLNGRNVAGPPPRPLTAYRVDLVETTPGQPATIVVSKA